MIYYIDFDNTLYDTHRLVDEMLTEIAKKICMNCDENEKNILDELKSVFRRPSIADNKDEFITYNIFELATFYANRYSIDVNGLIEDINNIISDGKKFLYTDTQNFINRLQDERKKGKKVCLLTYAEPEDHEYLRQKVDGAKIREFFDKIIITPDKSKEKLEYDNEGIVVVDDKPLEIENLNRKFNFEYNGKVRFIRLKRKDGKYSKRETPRIDGIEEVSSLDEIFLK